ncbi:unnamed protein product, partial [Symbiodinium microadriaticum]
MSDVQVGLSQIPMAGKGVFARRPFRKGELVSVSPVMFLQRDIIDREEASTLLINYCLSASHADILALPFGTAGMINHGGRLASNLNIQWFDWQDDTCRIGRRDNVSALFDSLSQESLLNASNAPLYMGYYAQRFIEEGEELTIDYGQDWEDEWLRYLEALEGWIQTKAD